MPAPERSLLLTAAVVGAALGAAPAVGAKHHRARFAVVKSRARGHVPVRLPGRPPLLGTPAVTNPAAPTKPTTTDPASTTPTPTCPTAIGVSEGEYYTHPSRTSLCTGSILMELRNTGEDPHNLEVRNADTDTVVKTWADVGPGDAVSQRLALVAGTYRLYCTLPDHERRGMYAVITVG